MRVIRYDEPRSCVLRLAAGNNNLRMVLIREKALSGMCIHAATEMDHEVGGYLLGFPVSDLESRVNGTYIEHAVRGIYSSTPMNITIYAESFIEVERLREQTNTILVGYYHSHPTLGVFLSQTDKMNFRQYHCEAYQIAVVVDPEKMPDDVPDVRSEGIGFFAWDEKQEPIKLPSENLIVVEECPELRDHL